MDFKYLEFSSIKIVAVELSSNLWLSWVNGMDTSLKEFGSFIMLVYYSEWSWLCMLCEYGNISVLLELWVEAEKIIARSNGYAYFARPRLFPIQKLKVI